MSVDDTIAQAAAAQPAGPTDPLQGLVGQTIAGRYRVQELLGEGGMGSVFRAHHLRLKHDVAVKVLRPELSSHPEAAPRFEREAQASSRLEHPNIVRVMDFGEVEADGFEEPVKFLVMQLLEGRELSAMLGHPLGTERSLRLVAQILDGLVHAHERGVVHRDLKPDNVFVTTNHAGHETLKLVDFGIAKLLDNADQPQKTLTQVGMVFGTPAYMSPEQAVGNPVDERTDVYAVGVLLYEMLSGHRPFRSSDPMTLLRMQILAQAEPIEGLPPEVQMVLGAMLAKEPDERTPSAVAALEQVQALLGPKQAVPTVSAPIEVAPVGGADDTVLPVIPSAMSAELRLGDAEPPRGIGGLGGLPKWVLPTAAGVVLLLGGVIAFSGDDDPEALSDEVAAQQIQAREEARQTVSELAAAVGLRAPDERLEELDLLVSDGNFKSAQALIGELEKEFSEDGRVAWKKAQILRRYKRRRDEMYAAYAKAIALETSLLGDETFRAEIAKLLSRKEPDERILKALAGSGGAAAKALLVSAVNRDKGALSYRPRHGALDAVGDEDEVNRPLNVALDLWQAPQADRPCAAFSEALDAAESSPDPYLRGSVDRAPTPKPGKNDDPKACEGIDERRKAVTTKLAESYPDAEPVYPADYSKDAKRRRSGGGTRRRSRNPFRRLFR